MSDSLDKDIPPLWTWNALPSLLGAGLALLIGFGAGWASARVVNEPPPLMAAARSLPTPPAAFSKADWQQFRPPVTEPKSESETAEPNPKPVAVSD
jgi:hypothetical protein